MRNNTYHRFCAISDFALQMVCYLWLSHASDPSSKTKCICFSIELNRKKRKLQLKIFLYLLIHSGHFYSAS